MLNLSVFLNLAAVAMLAATAARYYFGPAPTSYHAEILSTANTEINETVRLLFATINRILGASFMALALAVLIATLFGIWQDIFWAKGLVLAVGIVTGTPSTFWAREVERKTGVRTPWRGAAAITTILTIAFLLSIL